MLDVDLLDAEKSREPRARYSTDRRSLPWRRGGNIVTEYRFSLIIATSPLSHDEILDVTDALGGAGCTDASIRGHSQGMELIFDRTSDSLQAAIASAIADVERAGCRVAKIEMEPEAIPT
jgi:hypothetical protein